MNVTIIGTGKMAKGIATRLLCGGHKVTFHAQDETKSNELASHLKDTANSADFSCEPIGSHLEDIVILATPYTEVDTIAKEYDDFKDKIVVDITNPVDFNTFELIPEPGQSGAQEIAKLIPDAKVVKAFNTTLASALEASKIDGKQLDVFIAGDDEDAKSQVSELIKSSDMRPIDVRVVIKKHLPTSTTKCNNAPILVTNSHYSYGFFTL